MLTPEGAPLSFARHTWYDDIDLSGAGDRINVRRLVEGRPMTERKSFKEFVTNDYMPETDYLVATKGKNYAFVYIPTGSPAKINHDKLGWKQSVVW